MHFAGADPVPLDLEHFVDSAPLGPPPAPPGCYGCATRLAEESRFAERDDVEDFESVTDRPHPLLRRRFPGRRPIAVPA
jgi:hypothetical protein